MSRTKDAVWDQLESQYQTWQQADTAASQQIESDQKAAGYVALPQLATASDDAEMEF